MLPLEEIREVVGPAGFSQGPEDLLCHSYDATGLAHLPDVVVFPKSTGQVASILRLANEHDFAVVPRGAGSGTVGGAVPVKGGVVLAFNRMNRIEKIDPGDLVAVVEPGVVTGHLKREAEKLGLFYPPDPASLDFCTIGGNVATCAGGASALKYGVTRDYVLGLEAVLATGEVARTGVRTAKGVVGYDLTRLIVGSEGTLAVVTKIVLRLIPRPPFQSTLIATLGSLEAAADAVSSMLARGIVPASLEFMDRLSIACVKEKLGPWAEDDPAALLIIKVDGDELSVRGQVEAVRQTLIDGGVERVRAAGSAEESEAIWAARRAISPAAFRLAPHKVSEDITVPRSRLPEAVAGVRSIAGSLDLPVLCFGHAGDGNIHVNLMIDRTDRDQVQRAASAVKKIFGLTLELGGTLSGEHGVGITKAPYLGMELDKLGIDLMRRIKRAFDPKNILNPGKLFLDETAQDPLLSGRV